MRYTPFLVGGHDPLDHLALENILLETLQADQAFILFYINRPSVIIGRNQNPWREVAYDATIPFYRRSSGGGAVYHDEGNLNWAFIIPRHGHDQDAELEAVARGISSCGVEVAPGAHGGIYCTETTGYGGRKVSGTARRFDRASVLHHGTVLVKADMQCLHECLGGIETQDDYSIASVSASPVNLCDIHPGLTVQKVMKNLSYSITGKEPGVLPLGLVDNVRQKQERTRLATNEWAYGLTPPFVVHVQTFSHLVTVRVRAGLVESTSVSRLPVTQGLKDIASDRHIETNLVRLQAKPFSTRILEEIRVLMHS
ncbi:MAG: lipoate--protein ligase family protein [Spirochaetales bacterium]|nr:MAG: lipoate--protein ligase family protein [Spirochaetales bacterium]